MLKNNSTFTLCTNLKNFFIHLLLNTFLNSFAKSIIPQLLHLEKMLCVIVSYCHNNASQYTTPNLSFLNNHPLFSHLLISNTSVGLGWLLNFAHWVHIYSRVSHHLWSGCYSTMCPAFSCVLLWSGKGAVAIQGIVFPWHVAGSQYREPLLRSHLLPAQWIEWYTRSVLNRQWTEWHTLHIVNLHPGDECIR